MFDNYCSFWGDNEFSLEAATGKVLKRYPSNYVETEVGIDCLKTAVIVGENAGGKSNFINSLKTIKAMFADNAKVKSFLPYVNNESLRKVKLPKQTFELVILTDNNRTYTYTLVIDLKGIVAEKLYTCKKYKGKKYPIFYIERDDVENCYKVLESESIEIDRIVDKSNMEIGLFITKLAILGNTHAMAVTDWVNNRLYTESVPVSSEDNLQRLQSDLVILQDNRYIDIFRMVDYSICGIELDTEKPYSKSIIVRKTSSGEEFRRELQADSAGVREFFAWAVQIYRVVYENKVVFADEMDRVLNPILSDRVISFINGKTHGGQFIFSTHNVLHLNLVTYMKEQIYFITKNKDALTSELYSLADFPEVRYETTKIYEFYMKGILGGTTIE